MTIMLRTGRRRSVVGMITVVMSTFVFLTPAALGQTTTSGSTGTASSSSASTGTSSGPVITTKWEAIALFVAMLLLGAAWFSITLYERYTANKWRSGGYQAFLRELLAARTDPLTAEELTSFERAARLPPPGTTGITRTLLALSLLTLVGIALAALLVGNSGAAGDTVRLRSPPSLLR